MRIEFFRSILRQDIGYFDVHSSAEDRFDQAYLSDLARDRPLFDRPLYGPSTFISTVENV